ncbi:MAG TPA: transglutaminase family protein [Steroidobacteraceae bacterium]|jgi:transglutaminase-like putative cysteine protease|nr:transglutaminase family protein [Steroidobacteraceae bacterium]
MSLLHIRHITTYRYRSPVQPGEHRLMTRPRDSHDLRLLDTALTIEPAASHMRWMHDVFGNSIAIVSFESSAQILTFTSDFRAEHYPTPQREITIEPYAQTFPFSYSAGDAEDLGRTKERHYPDPEHRVDDWAHGQLQQVEQASTLETLSAMTRSIKSTFKYQGRESEGVQTPLETLDRGSGSCRDFALFMMEAARSLGLAARFVSGYLYDEGKVESGEKLVGGGATHAWLQIYLPGAGWVEYDPTNALIGGRNLIRVAVTRDPSQAIPLAGSFKGAPDAFESMTVKVEITAD